MMKRKNNKKINVMTQIIESTKELLAFYIPGCIVATVFILFSLFLRYITRVM